MHALQGERQTHSYSSVLLVLAIFSTIASAQAVKSEGVIKAREGDSMVVQTSNAPNLVVMLNDSTKVGQVQGVF